MTNNLCRQLTRTLQKKNKKRAYCFAEFYIKKYFSIYLDKYIHKIGKLGKKNQYFLINDFIKINKKEIVEIIQDILGSHELFQEQFYLFASDNVSILMNQVVEMEVVLNRKLFSQDKNKEYDSQLYKSIVKEIVDYSVSLRKELLGVCSVAKTKVQEYWCDRVPPTLLIMGGLLIGKISLDSLKLSNKQGKDYENIFNIIGTSIVFFAAFYMIYLRLPHAVDGAAKQKASDYYKSKKISLGAYFAKIIPESDLYERQRKKSFQVFSYKIQQHVKSREEETMIIVGKHSLL